MFHSQVFLESHVIQSCSSHQSEYVARSVPLRTDAQLGLQWIPPTTSIPRGLPSGYVKIAIENGHFVSFPIEHGDFPLK